MDQSRAALVRRAIACGAVGGGVWGGGVCAGIIVAGVLSRGDPEVLAALVIYVPAAGIVGMFGGVVASAASIVAILAAGALGLGHPRAAIVAGAVIAGSLLPGMVGQGRWAIEFAVASALTAAILAPFIVSGRSRRRAAGRVDA
jgi:hypothetical protein